jgi:RNA polymerase sigma-70 factor (ECF subfamily)
MIHHDAGTTNPTLLNRLCDWQDREAWIDFVARYDPFIRWFADRYRLDAESTEELCQHIWIELSRRMKSFTYDPGKTFRGWLGRLCQSRAIDLLRKKKACEQLSLEDHPERLLYEDHHTAQATDPTQDLGRPRLLRQAQEIQDAIRRRVDERTWRIFWSIAIEGQTIREVADAEHITYYAAFAALKRTGRMLRDQGQRLMSRKDDRTNSSETDD